MTDIRQETYYRLPINAQCVPPGFWVHERQRGDLLTPLVTADFIDNHIGRVYSHHIYTYSPAHDRSFLMKVTDFILCLVGKHTLARHEAAPDGQHCTHCGWVPPVAW